MKKAGLFVVAVSILCIINTAHADRTVWYVHPDSTLNSIQTALDLCADNDIVLVAPGTYVENIVWPGTYGIHCVSEMGPEVTIIDGSNPPNPDSGSVIAFVDQQDTNTIIYGFTLINGTGTLDTTWGYTGGGIFCDNSSPTITNNIIQANSAEWSGGIGCGYNASPIISNNIINGNTADSTGGGVDCFLRASPKIFGNTISGNTAKYGGGISCDSLALAEITGNTITGNNAIRGGGIGCFNNSQPTISGDSIIGNTAVSGGGIYSDNSVPTITDNYIFDNQVATGSGGGILCRNSTSDITGNIITSNTAGYGGGISLLNFTTVTLTGNTITDNMASVMGGGIDCYFFAGGQFIHNTITGNTSPLHGGGISCVRFCSPAIDSCLIANNSGDGITCDTSSSPEIHYNDIYGNSNYGLRNFYASVTVNAEYNWWGDASGPYHPDSNPGGIGDSVSDYVDFIPWLTQPGVETEKSAQLRISKLQIYPNPFSGRVTLNFVGSNQIANMQVKIYDAMGRVVKEFENQLIQPSGKITWDGFDNTGHSLPSGIYFLKFEADNYAETKKLLLIK